MTVNFYNTKSDNRTMNKKLETISTNTIVLKENNSLTDPVLVLNNFNPNANYFYVDDYDRFYFITDYKPMTGHRTEITGHVDVLMSFKDEIANCQGFLKRSTYGGNAFMFDERVRIEANYQYEILNFLDDNSEVQRLADSGDNMRKILCVVG